jgi:hypothetical protein
MWIIPTDSGIKSFGLPNRVYVEGRVLSDKEKEGVRYSSETKYNPTAGVSETIVYIRVPDVPEDALIEVEP